MRTLTLTDGTEYALDWCNGNRGIFHANLVTTASFTELAAKFSNSTLTETITVKFGDDHTDLYEGYTELQAIQFDGWSENNVLITLYKPERVQAA